MLAQNGEGGRECLELEQYQAWSTGLVEWTLISARNCAPYSLAQGPAPENPEWKSVNNNKSVLKCL